MRTISNRLVDAGKRRSSHHPKRTPGWSGRTRAGGIPVSCRRPEPIARSMEEPAMTTTHTKNHVPQRTGSATIAEPAPASGKEPPGPTALEELDQCERLLIQLLERLNDCFVSLTQCQQAVLQVSNGHRRLHRQVAEEARATREPA